MFPAQRIEFLKSIIRQKKSVDVSTLSDALGVSEVTVRKYLDKLEQEGFLKKMHGGAILAEDFDEFDQTDENDIIDGFEDKEHIAGLASTLIEDGDSIFLGSGTTCYLLAKKMQKFKNITVVTNNVNSLEYLAPNVRNLYFIGGEIIFSNGIMSSYGQKALAQLDGMFVQKAFLTFDGIDLRAGITINDIGLLEISHKVANLSQKVIVMADHRKFDKIGLHHFNTVDEQKIYVSDKKLDDKYKKYFYEHNIKILTAYDL